MVGDKNMVQFPLYPISFFPYECEEKSQKVFYLFLAFSMMAAADDDADGKITYSEFADHFVRQNYSFDLDDGIPDGKH